MDLLSQAHALENALAEQCRFMPRNFLYLNRRERDVLESGQMGKQIETLEHHPSLQSHFLKHGFLFGRQLFGLTVLPGDTQIADANCSAIEKLEKVDAPQKRGFAAARRSHDDSETAARKFKRELFEESVGTERLR